MKEQLYAMLMTGGIGFAVSAAVGPAAIRALRRLKFGQKILEDGPTWHMSKQNTPTMGGVIFIAGIAAALAAAFAMGLADDARPVYMLALSLVFGGIGFIDDYTKEGLCLQSKKGKGEEKLLSALREEIRSSDVCTKGF